MLYIFTLRYPSNWTLPPLQVIVQVQGVKRTLVLDSGSCCSILQPGVADKPMDAQILHHSASRVKNLEVQGEQTIKFFMVSVTFSHNLVVRKLPKNAVAVSGINFLLSRKAKLNLENESFNFT